MKLKDRVAIITGGGTGIGRACSQLFAKEGAKVVIASRGKEKEQGEDTVRLIKEAGGEARFILADVTHIAEIESLIKTTVSSYGKLDIFFSNAGVNGPGHFEDTTEADFDQLIAINLKAAFFGAQYAVPYLKKNGGGIILFTSSGLGLKPAPHSPAYSASKAGLNMMMRALAVLLAPDNIRVNSICPGPVWTPLWQSFITAHSDGKDQAFVDKSLGNRLIRRYGTVEETATAALYLVSDDASYITGLALPIEGGQHAM